MVRYRGEAMIEAIEFLAAEIEAEFLGALIKRVAPAVLAQN